MYAENLASYLTGATVSQLKSWRQKKILVPEVSRDRPPIYSFRDLAALRTIARLRAVTSAQKIAKAFENLSVAGLSEHPSAYKFTSDGSEIWVDSPEYQGPVALVKRPGAFPAITFEDIGAEFENFRSRKVVPFRRPSAYLELDPARMGGVPTITGTRVDLFTVLSQVDADDPESIGEFVDDHDQVSEAAVRDVLEFDYKVQAAS